MTGPVDDFSVRTGSSRSVVLTVVGLYLRRVGGWMATSSLVRLADDAGSPPPRTRTAIARLKRRGVLVSDPRGAAAGYRFDDAAATMFRRGDRRIFGPRRMGLDEPWCLISYSLGEDQRSLRHQLRRRLQWIGCGTVAPGLWICPDHLSGEVDGILGELRLRGQATLFRVDRLRTPGPAAEAVARWWDLDALAQRHRQFQLTAGSLLGESGTGTGAVTETGTEAGAEADAFRRYLLGMDAWRDIPYLDPGLPAELLPADWSGPRSVELFDRLQSELAGPAWQHVEQVVGSR